MEFLYEYGLYLAKAITIVAAILIVVANVVGAAAKQKTEKGQLEITSISEQLEELKQKAMTLLLDKSELKKFEKEQKKKQKAEKNQKTDTPNLFVIDFKGSMDANEVEGLRNEVTAILNVAKKDDEVFVRLESGGGVVHGYGLAASQLQRIRDKQLKLTISVDKVAASGGYMMACVADEVLAAKFAIIGSIGVIAQLPNFNKLLKKNDIDFEQHTAGQFKRTLTIFGENTDDGREKFRDELEEVHSMFKTFVSNNRQSLDIDKVATGEYWYGDKAFELGLVDKIQTSDDFLLSKVEQCNVYKVAYQTKKALAQRLTQSASIGIEKALLTVWEKVGRSYR